MTTLAQARERFPAPTDPAVDRIGAAALKLLADRDSLTAADLVAHFRRQVHTRRRNDPERRHAEHALEFLEAVSSQSGG